MIDSFLGEIHPDQGAGMPGGHPQVHGRVDQEHDRATAYLGSTIGPEIINWIR